MARPPRTRQSPGANHCNSFPAQAVRSQNVERGIMRELLGGPNDRAWQGSERARRVLPSLRERWMHHEVVVLTQQRR
jgi:hypothetical protein